MIIIFTIITFFIIIIISLLLILHHCFSSKFHHLPPPFKCICYGRSLDEEVKQRFSAPVGMQLQTAILYEWCCKSAPGRDSAPLFCIKTLRSCQIRPGRWCFHVCNWARYLSTGHICYEPCHRRKARLYYFFIGKLLDLLQEGANCVGGEKEVNHDQFRGPQKQHNMCSLWQLNWEHLNFSHYWQAFPFKQ